MADGARAGRGEDRSVPMEETGPSGFEIAVIGMAGRLPGADDPDAFWANLEAGVESIETFSDEDLRAAGVPPEESSDPHYVRRGGAIGAAETFDARFFGFYPREAEILDPQQRILLECAWEALERAGYVPGPASGVIGVYAGAGANTYLVQNLLRNREIRESVHGYQLTLASDKDFLCTRISYKLDLRGPSVTVQTGCSTSLVAVHLACQGLIGYHCDMALAGGVTVRPPLRAGYLYQEGGIASPTGRCRAFDAAADGTVPGAGAGLVVLKRLADAVADGDHIHAVIRGSAVNNDGADKVGYTAPSVTGQAEAIAAAMVVSDVHPDTIGYVEAHGTGTSLGDPIELAALSQAYRDLGAEAVGSCPIGSVKTNIGHLDAAAGVVSLLKTVMAIERRIIPPSLHFDSPNPAIDFGRSPFFVNARRTEWAAPPDGLPRRAAVSSFGMGGTNAHVVLEEAPRPEPSRPSRTWKLLLLSARSRHALDASTERLAEYLRRHPDLDLADVAWTLQVGRRRFEHTRAVVCRDSADFLAVAERKDPKRCVEERRAYERRSVSFLFSGQGAQYVGMGRELYQLEPAFRRAVDVCAERLRDPLGLDIRDVLYPDSVESPPESGDRLNETWLTQPALFVVEYALTELWKDWGIRPDAMLGHSIGEYVAACVAGVFTLEDALALVAERGRLMQSVPAGSMLAVHAPVATVRPLLVPHVSVAAINAPGSCVVSGPTDAVERLREVLETEGLSGTVLRTSHAFHSAMMEPILEPFADRVSRVNLRPPEIPFLSNVTGTWITDEEATDPAYWARHLRYPVRFAEGLGELLGEPERVLVEIGPGTTLSTLAALNAEAAGERDIVPSVRHPRDVRSDLAFVLGALGRLVGVGVEPDWERFHSGGRRRRVPLPTYPFERQRYWVDPDDAFAEPADGDRPRRTDRVEEWIWLPTWTRVPAPMPDGTGPILVLADPETGRELVQRLEARGVDAIDAEGDRFSEAGIEKLLARLEQDGRFPARIAHVLSLSDGAPGSTESGPGPSRAFHTLRNLCSALGRVASGRDVELVVVTSGLQDVLGDEPLSPGRADILGLCDVVGGELPGVRCRSVDVEWGTQAPEVRGPILARLAEEIRGGTPEETVALRGRHRWVRDFAQTSPPGSNGSPPVGAGDVWLVTGGLGRVGLVLAETLARIAPVRLALLGRSAFPERDSWDDWISSHGPDDPTSDRIRRIRAIEEAGAEVRVFRGDVTDPARMSEVAAEILGRFGPVRGVLHAAGSIGETTFRTIADTDEATTREQLAAKVRGLETLEAALAEHDPELWILVSSLASVLGGIGFAAYSAANHVLDAFAVERARASRHRWLSVNWDAWNFDGPATDGAGGLPGGLGLDPAEGSIVFERLLRSGASGQIVVSTADLRGRRRHAERSSETEEPDYFDSARSSRVHARPELGTDYEEPRSELERRIIGSWEQILGIAPIGVHDDFFELGGHSLLATQLVTRLRDAFRVELPIAEMFADPTPAGLAALIERAGVDGDGVAEDAIVPVDRGGDLPLSFAQQRMWFLDQLEPGSPLYNNSAAIRIRGPLSASILETCLNAIVARHEALRTSFEDRDGTPVQRVFPELELHVDVVDLGEELDEGARDAELRRRAHEDAIRPFDLSSPPLLRVTVARLGPEDHVALVTMHHIVSDGWSVQVLLTEIASLYPALAAGDSVELDPLPVQYADYSVWQRRWMEGSDLERQLAAWRERLREMPEPVRLPIDRPRPAVQGFRGGTLRLALPPELTAGLRSLARRNEATPFMVLAAAFDALLHRYSQQDEIVLGTPVANRNRAEIEGLIGFFVNTVVLRADCSGDPSFTELLARVRRDSLEAFANQDVPFEMVVEAVQPERDLSRTPLFQVMFAYQKEVASSLAPQGMTIEPVLVETGTAKFDLTLSLEEGEDDVTGWLNYNTDLFDARTVERLASHFQEILSSAVADPGLRLSELSVLTPDEERQLLAWGRSGEPEPEAPERIPVLAFLEIATSEPDRVAVLADGAAVGYGSLAAHAATIEHQLDAAGIPPDAVVAVALRRSPLALAAMLGIMESGRTYLPIDPALPGERIRYLLGDSGAKAILADQEAARGWVAGTGVTAIEPLVDLAGEEEPVASRAVDPDGAAYIIYTSGSTGLPKGIRVANRELALHVEDVVRHFELSSEDRVLQFASLGFDQSIEQILPTLAVGATLVMRGEDVWTAEQLHRTVVQERLSVVNLPPAYLHLWAEEWAASEWDPPADLRLVIAGGEELRPETVRLWARTPSSGVRLLNAYGPTEATITATTHEVRVEEDARRARVPIGRPFGGRSAHVVDGRGTLMPVGVPGELVLGGARLATGYVGRDDLTRKAFIPDPFSSRPGDCLYRTGDRARVLPGGEIEFLGRLDDQLKIRGYRIEPGEVESVLAEHPLVRDAVVNVAGDGVDRRRLVAFVVAAEPGTEGIVEVLRHWLAQRLPGWMVPSEFVTLPEIPRMPSGKVDRSRLTPPDPDRSADVRAYSAPRTPVEAELARIWAEVLELERVGIHDDFFELGGHSLLGTRVISRVRRAYPIEIPLRRLFETPTVAGLATIIAESLAEQTSGEEMRDLLEEIEGLSEEEVRSLLASDPSENR